MVELCKSCRKELTPGMREFQSWRGSCCSYDCAERVEAIIGIGDNVLTWIGGLSIPLGWVLIWMYRDTLHLTFLTLSAALFGVFCFGVGLLQRKENMMKDASSLAVIVMGVCFVGVGLYAAHAWQPDPAVVQAAQEPVPATASWYSGGTLHQANDMDWLLAMPENRLATSADFVAATKEKFGVSSIDELRGPAEQMNGCITEAAKAKSGQTVRSLAVVCGLMLTSNGR